MKSPTLAEAFSLIGKDAHVRTSDGLRAPVRIVDVRPAYGRVRFTVEQCIPGTLTPLRSVTVESDRVEVSS